MSSSYKNLHGKIHPIINSHYKIKKTHEYEKHANSHISLTYSSRLKHDAFTHTINIHTCKSNIIFFLRKRIEIQSTRRSCVYFPHVTHVWVFRFGGVGCFSVGAGQGGPVTSPVSSPSRDSWWISFRILVLGCSDQYLASYGMSELFRRFYLMMLLCWVVVKVAAKVFAASVLCESSVCWFCIEYGRFIFDFRRLGMSVVWFWSREGILYDCWFGSYFGVLDWLEIDFRRLGWMNPCLVPCWCSSSLNFIFWFIWKKWPLILVFGWFISRFPVCSRFFNNIPCYGH